MSNHKNDILIRISIITIGIIVLLVSLSITSSVMASPPPADYDTDRILDAIRQVETGGHKDPANAVGDGGKAIGPFQIHKCYWQDAVQYDKSIGGSYSDCKDEAYARKIVIAYCSRYCKNWNDETIARIHNGGPKGNVKSATVKYWKKVDKFLD